MRVHPAYILVEYRTPHLWSEKEGHGKAAVSVVSDGQCSLARALCPYGELQGCNNTALMFIFL